MRKEWSGERLEPFVLNETAVEHLHRYAIALQFVKGAAVLDIACGEGYGAALLADAAASVTGIDIDAETITTAAKKYKQSNLRFLTGDVRKIPLPDAAVEAVTSFETLEHIAEHKQMLAEIKRVLKPGGLLLISTPNKDVYSTERAFENRHHKKEVEQAEFVGLLRSYFAGVQMFAQRNVYGSFIYPQGRNIEAIIEGTGNYSAIKNAPMANQPLYFFALASDALQETNTAFMFDAANVYEARFEALKKTITYRIGAAVLSPLHWIVSRFKK